MIEFEDEVQWDMSFLKFWARNDDKRILCKVSRVAVAEIGRLPFDHVSDNEIKERKRELKVAFEPIARAKIERREFSDSSPLTVMIKLRDTPNY
jgi:hypothetical protein